MAFIDGHAHLPLRPGAREKMLALMDEVGIDVAVAIAGGAITPERLSEQIAVGGGIDVDIDNRLLAEECARSDGRLIPFYFANPHRGAARYQAEGRTFRGLKLGPAVHGVSLSDRRTAELVEVAGGFGQPVYLHCLSRPGFAVTDLVVLAEAFPRVSFILGHAGVGNCDLHAVTQIRNHPNIFFETSGGFTSVVQAACRDLGVERVIFGTEYPLQHPRVELAKAFCLGLSDADLERLLGGTMRELLA